MGTKKSSRKKEPYEDLDTKELTEEAVICEMYPNKRKPLTFQPFFVEASSSDVFLIPQRALLIIFDYVVSDNNVKSINELHSLAQVSEDWRQLIVSTPSLWRNLDLTDFDHKLSEHRLLELCESGVLSRVEKISVTGWNSPLIEIALTKIATSSCESLKEVNLKDCSNLSYDLLQLLAEKCSKLSNVDLSKSLTNLNEKSGSKKSGANQNKTVQASVLQNFLSASGQRLTQLNLAENTFKAPTHILKGILDTCPNLQLLDLSNIDTTSNVAVNVNTLQLSCPLIKILRLANIALRTTSQNTNGFPDLEELSIPVNGQHEVGHNDTIIYWLTKTAENLKLLDIRGSKHVTVSCLIKIPAWNLQHLAISNCQHLYKPDLELVLKKWKHSLVEIDISWNNNDESIDTSLETLSTDENTSLSIINLRGSSASFPAIKKLLQNCEKLKLVDLQSCRGLPRGIKRTFSGEELLKFKESILQGQYD